MGVAFALNMLIAPLSNNLLQNRHRMAERFSDISSNKLTMSTAVSILWSMILSALRTRLSR